MAHVLQAIDEPLDLLVYNSWNVILPEGRFLTEVGNTHFEDVLRQVSPDAIPEWQVGPCKSFKRRNASHEAQP